MAAPNSARASDALSRLARDHRVRGSRLLLEERAAESPLAAGWLDRATDPFSEDQRASRAVRRLAPATVAALDGAVREIASARQRLEARWAEENRQIWSALHDLACDRRFREAVVWQSPVAFQTGVDALARVPAAAPDIKKLRTKRQLVASYLQRYCAKNDTVGFFGPIGWAEFDPRGSALCSRAGPELVKRREIYFENWCIVELAETLSGRAALRQWCRPRLSPCARIDAGHLVRWPSGRQRLDRFDAAVLAACDGTRSARAIAAGLTGDAADPAVGDRVLAALTEWSRLGVLLWGFEVPQDTHPEQWLRRRLNDVADAAARASAMEALDELDAARDRVALAVGDPEGLWDAMQSLDRTFTARTGKAATRSEGETYAGRSLVYEDCQRDLEARIGPALLDRLGPPLTLVLQAMRWFTSEIAGRASHVLDDVFARASEGASSVGMGALQRRIFQQGGLEAVAEQVSAELPERWREVLELGASPGRRRHYRAEDLADRVGRAFPARGAGWDLVRYVSPDVLIAARDEEAVCRGEFELVLGEIHPGNTLATSLFVPNHPQPAALVAAAEQDLPGPMVLPVVPRSRLQRGSRLILGRDVWTYEFSADPANAAPDRILRDADLVVSRVASGALEVAHRSGAGPRFGIVNFLGFYLWSLCFNRFRLVSGERTPRITVDGVVLARERWEQCPDALEFASAKQPLERYVAARQWAADLGLPRFVFVKAPQETKPCYLDLESPAYVEMLSKLVRRASKQAPGDAFSITEMLPGPDQCWLLDSAGERYCSELRLVALDLSGPAPK